MELLVVLAVMGVMMGLIGFTLLGGGGNELGTAPRELLGMIQKNQKGTNQNFDEF